MRRLFLAILTGLFYTLAFPSCNLWPLAWVFAVPLLMLASEDMGRGEIFAYGMVAGIVAWAGTLYWIAYVMESYGGMGLAPAALLLLLLVTYMALYFGLFGMAVRRLMGMKAAFLWIPGIWILLELVRSYVMFGGFPWALIGYTQFPFKPFIQIAEFGGVYLIGGIILMVNVALFNVTKKEYLPLVVSGCIVAVCSVWGYWRMDSLVLPGEPVKAGVAQANISQEIKWLPEMVSPTIDIYSALTDRAVEEGAEIVVWPETACNFFLFGKWPESSRIIDLSKKSDARLVMGSPSYEDGRYYNRVWVLHRGRISGYYDKVHLVPFGEYLPLAWLVEPFFGNLTQGVGDFSRAGEAKPVKDMGIVICFESIFPRMTAHLCRKGAGLLVNVSNDAWFKTWSTPEQHLFMAAFRTIESRRWMLRSVNHGISAIINPFGQVVSRVGLLQEGVITGEITRTSYLSFYTKYGPVLPLLWAFLSATAALTIIRRRC